MRYPTRRSICALPGLFSTRLESARTALPVWPSLRRRAASSRNGETTSESFDSEPRYAAGTSAFFTRGIWSVGTGTSSSASDAPLVTLATSFPPAAVVT